MKSIQLITTNKWQHHTDLFTLLTIISSDINNRYWQLSDWEGNKYPKGYNKSNETIIVKGNELLSIIENDFQLIWGVLSGSKRVFDKNEGLPYSESNNELWKPNYKIQNSNADIEIVAWDSTYTLITCEDEKILEKIFAYLGTNTAFITDCLKDTKEYYKGQTVNEMLAQSGFDSIFYEYYDNNEYDKAENILYYLGLSKTIIDGIIKKKSV